MYDIRQFKPTLYLLVILGFTGFAIAAEEPALWVLGVGAAMLNAWLVRAGKFAPMPRWLSNGITLLALAYVAMHWAGGASNTTILLVGQFLVLLQVVKLFEQRANRDYAQIIVLSLLLMVAAAISTASLAFGAIFIGYLFLSLYGCLLFHLKVEADRARTAQSVPPEKFNAATLRQDQRYLPRSMRRLTALVSVVALSSAVFVFLFFPRGAGAGMLGQMQMRSPEVLTGFSDEVQFNQVARITQNDTPVAQVTVWHNGKPYTTGSLRLRGATFDRYSKNPRTSEWHWDHSRAVGMTSLQQEEDVQGGKPFGARGLMEGAKVPEDQRPDTWRQVVRLEPIGSKAVFALAGMRTFIPGRDVKLSYSPFDETLQRLEGLNAPLEYEVISNGIPTPPERRTGQGRAWRRVWGLPVTDDDAALPPLPDVKEISPEIVAFANDPQVTGGLAQTRPKSDAPVDVDEEIARRMEQYFKSHFGYTLDLTDAAALFEGKDPLAVFVTQTKRGHCEFFAGAMTLACQSLGLHARMVAGFNTDEYNSVAGFFQVRQAHAHTWVEVLTTHGWETFDPTSGREMFPNESRSAWQKVKHAFEWMEANWAGSVIAYDGDRRENVIQKLDTELLRGTYRGTEKVDGFRRWWRAFSENLENKSEFWTVSTKLLAGLISTMCVILVGAIGWYVIEQRRIRRRAAKIGLEHLPVPEQMRLARQLGFYATMNDLLDRQGVPRPRHLTPREFSRTLTFLPTEAYDLIERLTNVFYRVRYGGADVPMGQQRRLDAAVERLSELLSPRGS